jgi:hypothetical protein
MAYTLAQGLDNSFSVSVREFPSWLAVTPLVALLLFFTVLGLRHNSTYSHSQPSPALSIRFLPGSESNNSGNNNNKGDSTSSTSTTPSTISPLRKGTPAPVTPSTTLTIPPTTDLLGGGMGGGGVTPSAPAVSTPDASTQTQQGGILPLQTTVTVPATSVQVGQKTLISTDGTTISVN